MEELTFSLFAFIFGFSIFDGDSAGSKTMYEDVFFQSA